MKYLDPVALARIKGLRHRIFNAGAESSVSGAHKSVSRGFSQEFAVHKQYHPGDETKFIDWKVYGRKDRYYVKEFQEERSLRLYLLVDASASMAFSGPGPAPAKWEYACRLAVSSAFLSMLQGDYCGLMIFSDSSKAEMLPGNSMANIERIDSALAGISPSGTTDFARTLEGLLAGVKRRSAFMLISDMMSPDMLEGIRMLTGKKHSAFVFHLLDLAERDFNWKGNVEFDDMETGEKIQCRPSAIRELYRSEFDKWVRACESGCRSAGAAYCRTYTDIPPDIALSRILSGVNKTLRGAK